MDTSEDGNNLTPEMMREVVRYVKANPLPEKIDIDAKTWALMCCFADMLDNIVEGRN